MSLSWARSLAAMSGVQTTACRDGKKGSGHAQEVALRLPHAEDDRHCSRGGFSAAVHWIIDVGWPHNVGLHHEAGGFNAPTLSGEIGLVVL